MHIAEGHCLARSGQGAVQKAKCSESAEKLANRGDCAYNRIEINHYGDNVYEKNLNHPDLQAPALCAQAHRQGQQQARTGRAQALSRYPQPH